ncbi:MAG: transporter ATP-binding protein [Paenibacillaceae bacterium]|jgi:ABC-type lipoprotein export system ATPase subunit|nr:transporter ATP-binding protein [Paenibacillaceae bacterium]
MGNDAKKYLSNNISNFYMKQKNISNSADLQRSFHRVVSGKIKKPFLPFIRYSQYVPCYGDEYMEERIVTMLRVDHLSHSFLSGSETTQVLQNIHFQVQKGEMLALLGSSGSGKSTLLNLMAGLMKPTEGDIYIAGENIVKMNENKLAEFRRHHIGFIFQAYELIANLTVRENVELPLIFQSAHPAVRKKKALALLEQVGIPEKAELFPSQLSGGQQQRVSIARSLVTEPSVIFADEPTGNLDTKTEDEIISILKRLNDSMATTFIIVTHEHEVARHTKRIITLRDGCLLETGAWTAAPAGTESEAEAEAEIAAGAGTGGGAS